MNNIDKRYFYRNPNFTNSTTISITLYEDGNPIDTVSISESDLNKCVKELHKQGYTFGYPKEEIERLKMAMEVATKEYKNAKKEQIINKMEVESNQIFVENIFKDMLDYFGIDKEGSYYKEARDYHLYSVSDITPELARLIKRKVDKCLNIHDRFCDMKYIKEEKTAYYDIVS